MNIKNEGENLEKFGVKIGFIFSLIIFTTILFFVLKFFKKIPTTWNFWNILIITLIITFT